MEYREQITELTTYYEALRKKYKWRADNGALMMIASQYVGSKQSFNFQQYIELVEFIKQESSAFSYIQSTLRFSLAGLLINQADNPQEAYKEVQSCYDQLIAAGFQRSPHSYIAAYALYLNIGEHESTDEHVKRAKEMYDGMKKQHFFLTSHEDYPLSVLLSESGADSRELLDDMAYYYDELHLVLWKGNNRQFLSQILTYGKRENRQFLIQNTVTWVDDLKVNGFKLRGLHLPIVGVLSLIGTPSLLLSKIKTVYEELISISRFKWYKDHCFMIAVKLVIQKEMEEDRLLDVGLSTTAESILQAQQAAMIATMTAATAAANASNNG